MKITPLGSHDGEFCARDRAMLFEDPDGTRILVDSGKPIPGTKTARFVSMVKDITVHMPLGGRTMVFDANAKCVSGC